MKNTISAGLAVVLAVVLSAGACFALEGSDGRKLSGPHYQFNLIGKPHDWECNGKCAESSGNTIMVDLVTESNLIIDGYTPETCPDDYSDAPVVDDPSPKGKKNDEIIKFDDIDLAQKTRIYFNDDDLCGETVESFKIADRDATDNRADICLPLGENDYPEYNVYVRILGKPNKCMDINGLVFYDDTTYESEFYDTGWYWTGSVFLARKGGKSIFYNADDLFDIEWCTGWEDNMDGTYTCTSAEEYSVFSNLFPDYVWQINNYGARNVQVRLYPRQPPVE
jgi:hypothetical protein